MRLTKSALTMLNQHYRAIYKHAYVLGLATVAVSALSVGAANADEKKWNEIFTKEEISADTTTNTISSADADTTAGNFVVTSAGKVKVAGANKIDINSTATKEFNLSIIDSTLKDQPALEIVGGTRRYTALWS